MKIKWSYGQGSSDVFYSIKDHQLYAVINPYQRDHLIKNYNGTQYYTSRSGCSGAGYFEIENNKNDLIQFGVYRTDGKDCSYLHIVGESICGYCPLDYGKGVIDYNAPIILVKGREVAFCHNRDIEFYIQNWDKIEFKEMKLEYYDIEKNKNIHGEEVEGFNYEKRNIKWYFSNIYHLGGVSATEFITEISYIKRYAHVLVPDEYSKFESILDSRLHIHQLEENLWIHINSENICDKVWTEDPHKIEGELINGWYCNGNGLFYNIFDLNVEIIIEHNRKYYENGKYYIDSVYLPDYCHYEDFVSKISWFNNSIEVNCKDIYEKFIKKLEGDLRYARQNSGIETLELMKTENYSDYIVNIEDSFNVGNCKIGTLQFIKKFKLKENMTFKELIDHSGISKMIENYHFRKIIENIIENYKNCIPINQVSSEDD